MGALAAYFLLAVAVSWLIGLPLYGSALGLEGLPALPHHRYLVAFGPAIAAFAVTVATQGKAGVRELASGVLRWRVRPDWYMIALFGSLALILLAALVLRVWTGEILDARLVDRSREFPQLGQIEVWLIHALSFGLGQEIGWRGFALPRLQRERSALSATLLLAAMWAFWSVPVFVYAPPAAGTGPAAVAGWLVALTAGSILLTWLYNSTMGSVLVAILFHGTLMVAFDTQAAQGAVAALMVIFLAVWALLVVFVGGPESLSRFGKHTTNEQRPE